MYNVLRDRYAWGWTLVHTLLMLLKIIPNDPVLLHPFLAPQPLAAVAPVAALPSMLIRFVVMDAMSRRLVIISLLRFLIERNTTAMGSFCKKLVFALL